MASPTLGGRRVTWPGIAALDELLAARWLPWLLGAFGVLLRLRIYGANRSLWIDEAYLALNIVERDFVGLLGPLADNQIAPVGYLLLTRLAVELLGPSEYALRLVPLLASLATLPVFYRVARFYLAPASAALGLGLLCVLEPLLYYANEVKQYSLDALAALLLLWLLLLLAERWRGWRGLVGAGLAGGAVLWFSHPALFVLAGGGVVLAVQSLLRRDMRRLVALCTVGAIWLASFAGSYVINLQVAGANSEMREAWDSAYMPLPPRSAEDLLWYADTFFQTFHHPVGFGEYTAGVGALLAVAGAVALFRAERLRLWLLVAPVLTVLLVSALRIYPFDGRLLLFAVPLLVIATVAGSAALVERLRAPTLVQVALLLAIGFEGLAVAGLNLWRPKGVEELRPVLAEVRQEWQPGDLLYVYYGAEPAFRFYNRSFGFAPGEYRVGVEAREREEWARYAADIEALDGRQRVWVIFTHIHRGDGADEEKLLLFFLDRLGERRAHIQEKSASAHLYDLSGR